MSGKNNSGWKKECKQPSLPEVYRSIEIPEHNSWLKKFLAFAGPGYLIAVGYIDPGNWSTGLEGGSKYHYSLLSVILISNIFAMIFQALSGKLGIVTGRDLAQACRDHYSKPVTIMLWILCEIAIAACDMAELIGSAIALQILFGIPLFWGIIITSLDIMVLLFLQNKGFRYIEILVISLVSLIGVCFLIEMFIIKPDLNNVVNGLIPTKQLLFDKDMLYLGIAILGATVMPHNLYLQSSIVQTRRFPKTNTGKKMALRYSMWDTNIALIFAFFINAAILIMSAAVFFDKNIIVDNFRMAHQLFAPILETSVASSLFAIALLASGQSSTLTGTMAGQIVMEGFLDIKLKPWLRRLLTRSLAVIPTIIIIWNYDNISTIKLLNFSQIILSMQLPFAVIPLILFTNDRKKMGLFVNRFYLKVIGWIVALIIVSLNLWIVYKELFLDA